MRSDAGTLLVTAGLITESQLRQALTHAVNLGGSLVRSLAKLGLASADDLTAFFTGHLQIPMAEASQMDNFGVHHPPDSG